MRFVFGRVAPLMFASTLLLGCASDYVTVAPKPPKQYTRLGPAKGEACGAMGLLGADTNFIPMGLNGRVERAYADAVASVPGATALVDVSLQESWYWWILATGRCTTITGVAIK